tara:strand:- start:2718 stop:3044 length:327 start_codon:yes stop_codon:yes gene_type:complete
MNGQNIIKPIDGLITGIIIPVTAFIYVCYYWKGKREIVLEISKNLEYPSRVEELLKIFDERKKEQIDYRRSGVISIFAGARFYLLGFLALRNILEGGGALLNFIGIEL